MVLIQAGRIQDINMVESFTPVTELMQRYAEWNPKDCEESYVSPGLLDVNVQSNGPWEGLAETTKAAIAGGITFVLVEKNLYALPEKEETLYCDVGLALVVEENKNPTIPDIPSSICALKVYLTPPSLYIPGSFDCLETGLLLATVYQLPLLVDPTIGTARLMYMASPCRFSSLEERASTLTFPDDRVFAAAFPEDLSPNSSNNSSDEEQTQETQPEATDMDRDMRLFLPSRSVEIGQLETLELVKTHSTGKMARHRKAANLKTIFDDLKARIKEMEHSIEDLSRVEQLDYLHAGQTLFSSHPPSESLPETARKRPRSLNLKLAPQRAGKDRVYLNHLANHPDHWETNGVTAVLSILNLKRPRCKVHFCNVSSAGAISRIHAEGTEELRVSVEISPNYLCFAANNVQDGDTRLKCNPPIRNKLNCNLLWDLLKMGKIDVLASHHQPIPPQYKCLETGSFKQALPGISCLGSGMQAVWTTLRAPTVQTHSSDSYIMRLARWTASSPAALLGLESERGSIAVGKWADLVVWNPEETLTRRAQGRFPEMSPYHGMQWRGHIRQVYVRGTLAYEDGECYPVGQTHARTK